MSYGTPPGWTGRPSAVVGGALSPSLRGPEACPRGTWPLSVMGLKCGHVVEPPGTAGSGEPPRAPRPPPRASALSRRTTPGGAGVTRCALELRGPPGLESLSCDVGCRGLRGPLSGDGAWGSPQQWQERGRGTGTTPLPSAWTGQETSRCGDFYSLLCVCFDNRHLFRVTCSGVHTHSDKETGSV